MVEENKLKQLQELVNNSHPSIKAVAVVGEAIFTCSDGSEPAAIMRLTRKVETLFEIEADTSGGANYTDIEEVRAIGGAYAERTLWTIKAS